MCYICVAGKLVSNAIRKEPHHRRIYLLLVTACGDECDILVRWYVIAELVIGPFSETQPSPTHGWTQPKSSSTLQWSGVRFPKSVFPRMHLDTPSNTSFLELTRVCPPKPTHGLLWSVYPFYRTCRCARNRLTDHGTGIYASSSRDESAVCRPASSASVCEVCLLFPLLSISLL